MLDYWLKLAFSVGIATTFGWNELSCGVPGHARRCATGAITASGVVFDTQVPQIAVAAPEHVRVPARVIYVTSGAIVTPEAKPRCVAVWLVDKMNPRWIGERGFDVNPEALRRLVGERAATPQWSGRLTKCNPKSKKFNLREDIKWK